MSVAGQLLENLTRQGFNLAIEGDGIRIRPASRLTPALRDAICQHKAELLAALDLSAKALLATAAQVSAKTPARERAAPYYAGWARLRIWGWQRIIGPRLKWWACEDLEDYVKAIGGTALDAVVLPEWERP